MTTAISFTLDSSACFVVSLSEPYGVGRAARSVIIDVSEVGGFSPRFAEKRPADAKLAIFIESDGQLAQRYGLANEIQADETFAIRAIEHDGKPAILVTGRGERGAIYGLYHFSRTQLGTDPFKHITGYRPPRRNPIVLENVDYSSPPPAFRYRGWHVETHTLVTPWRSELDLQHDFWQRLFETLLRCGGNMVKPEQNRPESMEVALAQKMGLLVTQEHATPFGVGMWEIESDDPTFDYSFDDHPQVFLDAWDESMQRYPDPSKVIWTLSYRGRGDRPFWEADRRYDTDAKRGELISRVLRAQKELVEKRFGHLKPAFIHNAWMEGNRLVSEGHTRVPEGVHTVWADNGYGTFRSMLSEGCAPEQVRDILPKQPTGGQHGVYHHISMWDFCTPFLTQFVPLDRIEREFARVVERQMTAYVLINVGHVSQCVLGAAAIADLWQNPGRWTNRGAEAFLHEWCEKYFGAAAAEDAMRCYDALFHGPIHYGEWGGWDDYVIGDVGYIRIARMFVQTALSGHLRKFYDSTPHRFFLNKPMVLAERMNWIRGKIAEAAPRWDEAQRLALGVSERLEGRARKFFDSDLLSQIEIHQSLNLYLQRVTDAVSAYERGEFAKAIGEARAAKECVAKYQAAIERRDYDRWDEGWIKEVLLRTACIPIAYEQPDTLIAAIENLLGERTNPFPNMHAANVLVRGKVPHKYDRPPSPFK